MLETGSLGDDRDRQIGFLEQLLDSLDDLRVMGYVINGEARCYPSALLNRHELVNDRYGNKPVTVGW